MAGYERQVREYLREHNCHFVRPGKGDHEIWYSPITNATSRWMAKSGRNEVLKQAGIGKKF